LGEDAGPCGFGELASGGAARERFSDEGIYTDAVRAAEEWRKNWKAEFWEMNALLAESDFISVHVPLAAETRRLFDAPKFRKMNRQRSDQHIAGPVVDERRWWRRWRAGRLRAAALDVYGTSPPFIPAERAKRVLAPHIASASLETGRKWRASRRKTSSLFLRDSGHEHV